MVDRRFNHEHHNNGQDTDLPPQFSTDAVARKGEGRRDGRGGGGVVVGAAWLSVALRPQKP